MTKAQAKKIKELTPLINAIKSKCLDCAGSVYEVKMCVCDKCGIFSHRLGLNSQQADFTREILEKTPKNETGEGVGDE